MNMSKVARSGKTSDAQVSKGSVSVSAALLVLISVLTAAFVNAETYSSNPHKGLEEKISAALSGGGAPVRCSNRRRHLRRGARQRRRDGPGRRSDASWRAE